MKFNVQLSVFDGNFFLGSAEQTFCTWFYIFNIRFFFNTYIDKNFRINTFFLIKI